MKVTVCQLHDEPDAFLKDWERLVAHTQTEHSDLVLLPEMPFFPWFATARTFNARVWAGGSRARRLSRQIGQREHPEEESLVIDHWQPTNLRLTHRLLSLRQ